MGEVGSGGEWLMVGSVEISHTCSLLQILLMMALDI